ncbi:MAG: glycine/betaine/sarcosine/D-proline family reductase selenoprotein B [Chloroflexi bacterium]|nr:glycine/betaine/sarcosine/D-proline family reductase selenoprotein B [Chloroflexota bacterium]
MSRVRLLHFLNQFFAGEGGEEKADLPLVSQAGPIGPGRRLQALLRDTAEIVATVYCGDNYFVSHAEAVIASITNVARGNDVGILVAGPSFMAGRYGFASAEICQSLSASLGLHAVTGMHPENPGVDAYRQYRNSAVYALPTAGDASGMEDALSRMARLVTKLAIGSAVGSASEEGYIPRGFRLVRFGSKSGAKRAVDMLLSKAAGGVFETEIPVDRVETIPVPPKIESLRGARLALVSTAGVVPLGNPDGFKANRNTHWRKYSIDGLDSMRDGRWQVMHGGYNTQFMEENPNYGVPLDACRRLEREGAFAKLYPSYYGTTGVGATFSDMQFIGMEMVRDLKTEGIDAVVLVST